ncbi:DUF722 domain-containing protein [Amphibacillus sediminis]|uniref:DUF722 domain-containing protein n=1 Tax=Amphibacillus sediminis TaxID=360185 RepID=UPI00082B27D6|nr:DUF722 domain-containing protein [Amphibacillus sediminis]
MGELAITKSTFKKVENEWAIYHHTLDEIKILEEAIIYPYQEGSSPIRTGGKANVIHDPTAVTTMYLTQHKQLNYLKEITQAIERVYDQLSSDQKKLVQIRYWTNRSLTWDAVAMACNISRRQALYWRNDIIHATIEILGWR